MHNKCLIFILTAWSYGALEGTASAFSLTKEPMSEELNLTESYLGIPKLMKALSIVSPFWERSLGHFS